MRFVSAELDDDDVDVIVIGFVIVIVIAPVIVAVHLNGNAPVGVIDAVDGAPERASGRVNP